MANKDLKPSKSDTLTIQCPPNLKDRVNQLVQCMKPASNSRNRRQSVASYVRDIICECFQSHKVEAFLFGSVPLHTYLPDGDIDVSIVPQDEDSQSLKDTWTGQLQAALELEKQNANARYKIGDVQVINAEVKLLKCLVDNIVVDISFNQMGGICTLNFLQTMDDLIGKDNLFKRSIILVKAWCYYESRLLGAHHGLISTYAVETLVLYIFNKYHKLLTNPIEVLYRFLVEFSEFDWEHYGLSLQGPVSLSALPSLQVDPHFAPIEDPLLTSERTAAIIEKFGAAQQAVAKQENRTFGAKFFNIVDPLLPTNNLGRSVAKASFLRIKRAFAYGAKTLTAVFQKEALDALDHFFRNVWNAQRPSQTPESKVHDVPNDVAKDIPRAVKCTSPMPSALFSFQPQYASTHRYATGHSGYAGDLSIHTPQLQHSTMRGAPPNSDIPLSQSLDNMNQGKKALAGPGYAVFQPPGLEVREPLRKQYAPLPPTSQPTTTTAHLLLDQQKQQQQQHVSHSSMPDVRQAYAAVSPLGAEERIDAGKGEAIGDVTARDLGASSSSMLKVTQDASQGQWQAGHDKTSPLPEATAAEEDGPECCAPLLANNLSSELSTESAGAQPQHSMLHQNQPPLSNVGAAAAKHPTVTLGSLIAETATAPHAQLSTSKALMPADNLLSRSSGGSVEEMRNAGVSQAESSIAPHPSATVETGAFSIADPQTYENFSTVFRALLNNGNKDALQAFLAVLSTPDALSQENYLAIIQALYLSGKTEALQAFVAARHLQLQQQQRQQEQVQQQQQRQQQQQEQQQRQQQEQVQQQQQRQQQQQEQQQQQQHIALLAQLVQQKAQQEANGQGVGQAQMIATLQSLIAAQSASNVRRGSDTGREGRASNVEWGSQGGDSSVEVRNQSSTAIPQHLPQLQMNLPVMPFPLVPSINSQYYISSGQLPQQQFQQHSQIAVNTAMLAAALQQQQQSQVNTVHSSHVAQMSSNSFTNVPSSYSDLRQASSTRQHSYNDKLYRNDSGGLAAAQQQQQSQQPQQQQQLQSQQQSFNGTSSARANQHGWESGSRHQGHHDRQGTVRAGVRIHSRTSSQDNLAANTQNMPGSAPSPVPTAVPSASVPEGADFTNPDVEEVMAAVARSVQMSSAPTPSHGASGMQAHYNSMHWANSGFSAQGRNMQNVGLQLNQEIPPYRPPSSMGGTSRSNPIAMSRSAYNPPSQALTMAHYMRSTNIHNGDVLGASPPMPTLHHLPPPPPPALAPIQHSPPSWHQGYADKQWSDLVASRNYAQQAFNQGSVSHHGPVDAQSTPDSGEEHVPGQLGGRLGERTTGQSSSAENLAAGWLHSMPQGSTVTSPEQVLGIRSEMPSSEQRASAPSPHPFPEALSHESSWLSDSSSSLHSGMGYMQSEPVSAFPPGYIEHPPPPVLLTTPAYTTLPTSSTPMYAPHLSTAGPAVAMATSSMLSASPALGHINAAPLAFMMPLPFQPMDLSLQYLPLPSHAPKMNTIVSSSPPPPSIFDDAAPPGILPGSSSTTEGRPTTSAGRLTPISSTQGHLNPYLSSAAPGASGREIDMHSHPFVDTVIHQPLPSLQLPTTQSILPTQGSMQSPGLRAQTSSPFSPRLTTSPDPRSHSEPSIRTSTLAETSTMQSTSSGDSSPAPAVKLNHPGSGRNSLPQISIPIDSRHASQAGSEGSASSFGSPNTRNSIALADDAMSSSTSSSAAKRKSDGSRVKVQVGGSNLFSQALHAAVRSNAQSSVVRDIPSVQVGPAGSLGTANHNASQQSHCDDVSSVADSPFQGSPDVSSGALWSRQGLPPRGASFSRHGSGGLSSADSQPASRRIRVLESSKEGDGKKCSMPPSKGDGGLLDTPPGIFRDLTSSSGACAASVNEEDFWHLTDRVTCEYKREEHEASGASRSSESDFSTGVVSQDIASTRSTTRAGHHWLAPQFGSFRTDALIDETVSVSLIDAQECVPSSSGRQERDSSARPKHPSERKGSGSREANSRGQYQAREISTSTSSTRGGNSNVQRAQTQNQRSQQPLEDSKRGRGHSNASRKPVPSTQERGLPGQSALNQQHREGNSLKRSQSWDNLKSEFLGSARENQGSGPMFQLQDYEDFPVLGSATGVKLDPFRRQDGGSFLQSTTHITAPNEAARHFSSNAARSSQSFSQPASPSGSITSSHVRVEQSSGRL